MKEEKEKKVSQDKVDGETNKKAFWIIGIALIVFLILVLGSIIGLRLTKNGVDNVVDKMNGIDNSTQNYEVLENGTKVNKSKNIEKAEFISDGIKVSNFTIDELNGLSTVITTVENTTDEKKANISIVVRLYDSSDTLIHEYSMLTSEIEAHGHVMPVTNIMKDCSNAANVEVEFLNQQQD